MALLRDRLPLVTLDLQRTPPGVYSLMQDIKQEQRHGEHLLSQSERLIEQLAGEGLERDGLRRRLDAAWDDLIFTQFHDILGGSSIPSAWRTVRAAQGRARVTGEEIVVETTRRWARRALPPLNNQQIVVYNPDFEPWSGLVAAEPWLDFEYWGERWLADPGGRMIPWQSVQAESPQLVPGILFPARVERGGYALIQIRSDARPDMGPLTSDLDVTPASLRNGRLDVALGPAGIPAIRMDGREILSETGMTLELREDLSDCWSFGTTCYRGPIVAAFRPDGDWIVSERGPLRARAWMEGWIGRSRVRWTASLLRDDPELAVELEVLFADRESALHLKAPLAWKPTCWCTGLPGGQIDRESGAQEWPMHAWMRADADDRHFAAITHDCYSASLEEGCARFTLLRGPRMGYLRGSWEAEVPEPAAQRAWHTDQGNHTFAFTFRCGDDVSDGLLHRQARQTAQPPVVFNRYEGLDRPPWGNIPPQHLR